MGAGFASALQGLEATKRCAPVLLVELVTRVITIAAVNMHSTAMSNRPNSKVTAIGVIARCSPSGRDRLHHGDCLACL